MKKIIAIIAAAIALSGCHIVPEGKVGLRINFDKTVEDSERLPGSFNQVITGTVIDVPVKDISVDVTNLTPLAADNSTMSDFDVMVVYNVNPSSVSEIYKTKNRSFHTLNSEDELELMHTYLQTTVRNAVYKVARKYEAMKMNDERQVIEAEILALVKETLAEEKLSTSITVSQIQVKSIAPSAAVKQAADNLVRAKSDLLAKEVEVNTAKKESERIAALNANAGAREYMAAQANLEIAYAIREGKVNTIVIPQDFRGIVNVK